MVFDVVGGDGNKFFMEGIALLALDLSPLLLFCAFVDDRLSVFSALFLGGNELGVEDDLPISLSLELA